MTGCLSETQESLTSTEAHLADRDEVLAQATFERTALSRALDHVVSDSDVLP